MKLLNFFVGDQGKKEIKRITPIVQKTSDIEPSFEQLSDAELKEKTAQFRQRFNEGMQRVEPDLKHELENEPDPMRQNKIRSRFEQKVLTELAPEAFAAVREAGKRVLGMRHFDVQLLGGMVLHDGKIAEMRTGEGKTLVATLPTYLNALASHGVHVVTVNDYLAKRDAQWMGKIYDALGMSVGVIGHETSLRFVNEEKTGEHDTDWPHLTQISRKAAYDCDITYGTNNEFGFDYLRDNMAQSPEQLVQRELWYAIVDEVDSILIDEARTPLIISAPAEESTNLYQNFAQVAKRLKREEDYTVDEKFRSVTITDEGIKKVENWVGIPNLYAPEHVELVHHLEEALKAQALFTRDKEYVVREGEVVIVDEFTGRMMPGRRYSEGLHQAIEAKEGVEIRRESNTLATISFQNLFRLYAKLSGMTGTAVTESEEFWKIYSLDVVPIPTHRVVARIDHQDFIYKNEAAKLRAVVEDIKARQERGQPVLVGTISIEKNEVLSRVFKQAGIKHQVLNAKHHEREAKIITQAGIAGAVTLATNMAGRGVDIILGGKAPEKTDDMTDAEFQEAWQAWEVEHQKVLELGGLCVIGTERHEARRIDNQLRGRAGRQGDPGESQFYVSMEDDLMRIFGGERMIGLMDRLGVPEDQPIQAKIISSSIESAQRRVEGHNFDTRKHLVEYDDVLNKHREVMYAKRRRILVGATDMAWLHTETLRILSDEEQAQYNQKFDRWGAELAGQVERAVWLRTIDTFWLEHLNALEALRTGIGLRGYGQHDPLVAYRQEGYELFNRLQKGIEQEVARVILHAEVSQQPPQPVAPAPKQLTFRGADDSQTAGFTNEESPTHQAATQEPVASDEPKVGRNDPCPCGATKADGTPKKFKHCHGK